MSDPAGDISVRGTRSEDFEDIIRLSGLIYGASPGWNRARLESHLAVFPEGQLVAVEQAAGRVVGMAASLIVSWEDYEITDSWRDFTDGGFFTNHDPNGRTLYGAEVMVHPQLQGHGVGGLLYEERRGLARRFNLRRIRAGSRLVGYHRYADEMNAQDYVQKVVDGGIGDATLSFQLKEGFRVLAVVPDYLSNDPASRGFAAVIEWINPDYRSDSFV